MQDLKRFVSFDYFRRASETSGKGRRNTRARLRRREPLLDELEGRVVLSSAAVSLGTAAQYGVLGLANTKIINSNVTISGDEGVSQGGTLNNMAPSTITGSVFQSSQGQYTGPGKLEGGLNVDPARLSQAGQDALSASSQAEALTPTQTLGTVNSPTTVAGNGGLNVINVNGAIKASLTLSGTPNDVFIVNVTGTLTLGGGSVLGLSGGVTADHVLYNFTGVGYTIATHVGNVINGTLLAPQCNISLDGMFNGEIIGGGGSINLLSGAKVNEVPFSGGPAEASLSGSLNGSRGSVLAGVTVTLTGTDDQGNAVTLAATTDAQGSYVFNDLQAGTYTIEEPSGYGLNQSTVGTVNGSSDGSIAAGDITQIILAAGDQGTNYTFRTFAG